MEFDFDYFPEKPSSNANPNLEELFDQLDKRSIDWDNFPSHQEQNDMTRSFEQNEVDPIAIRKIVSNNSQSFENSRDIDEISFVGGARDKSFHFEENQKLEVPEFDERYDRLQKLLQKAKGNNIEAFYRNIEQARGGDNENKFSSKEEFKEFKNNLKLNKRVKEENYVKEISGNNVGNSGGNNPFATSISQKTASVAAISPNPFSKKPLSNPFLDDNALSETPSNQLILDPSKFNEEDGLGEGVNEEQINQELVRYQQQKYLKEGDIFFNGQYQSTSKKDKEKEEKQLETIREEKGSLLLEKTIDEERLQKLLEDYRAMKSNFNQLMGELKQTKEGQKELVNELHCIKSEYDSTKHMHEQQAEHRKERRNKYEHMKQEVEKLKEGKHDGMFEEINVKIDSLENLVKGAIDGMLEEKENKFVPTVINYGEVSINEENKLDLSQECSEVTAAVNNLFQGQIVSPWKNNEDNGSVTNRKNKTVLLPQQSPQKSQQEWQPSQNIANNPLYATSPPFNNVSSPLQLDFTIDQPPTMIYPDDSTPPEPIFQPAPFAKQYFPNSLNHLNRNLRKCLTQKSSLVFESFEFYISAKYTLTFEEPHPALCELRIANKSSIDLLDLFVVVYGPQASSLHLTPNKIIHDRVKSATSFLFEVALNKQCIDDNGFSLQISYRVDSCNKKKVQCKIPVPLLQMLKPEFIYEEQFNNVWSGLENELYVAPKVLDSRHIRSHEDLKLLLPFTEGNDTSFAYGLMFKSIVSTNTFLIKIVCYVDGKASVHLRSSATIQYTDRKFKEDLLDAINFLCFVDEN